MRSIRKLFFQNAAGERRGLNGEDGIYATNLAGFGFSFDPSFADIGRGFFPSVDDGKMLQNNIAFTLVFTKSPYAAYQSFVDWLSASSGLTIVYNPTGRREFCLDATISFMQKGERNQVGWLEVPCGFFCNTPWYLPTPTVLSISGSGLDESIRYPYRYSSDLRYGQDSASSIRAIVAGAGHIPGSLQITFRGAVANPKIRLTGNATGKIYGVCSVAGAFSEADALEFSTRYENAYVCRIGADGTREDLLDVLDLSTTPFFHIPVDEACTLSIEADSPVMGRVDLLIYYYYRSV